MPTITAGPTAAAIAGRNRADLATTDSPKAVRAQYHGSSTSIEPAAARTYESAGNSSSNRAALGTANARGTDSRSTPHWTPIPIHDNKCRASTSQTRL